MSLRPKTLHYLNFQNQKTFLMKFKWNHCIVVNVNDVRKHWHDFILIATCFIFLNMAANRSHLDRSLKVRGTSEIREGSFPKGFGSKIRSSVKHYIKMEEEQEQNIWVLWKEIKLEKNQAIGVRNNKQSPHEMVIELHSENIPVKALVLKKKTSDFVKELGVPNFQASDGWLEKWKKDNLFLVFRNCWAKRQFLLTRSFHGVFVLTNYG